jgi:WS/DGAT/MGAT family acyltransferase
MEHLTPLDAAFLDAEDEDRHASLAIASVAVLGGPPPSHADFVDALRGRLPLVPRYRQKVRQVPLDLGQPVWVDDPGFDLSYHVRRTALPAPGDDATLCRLVARIMSQRLDRDRPLWECWVIEGLAGGRWGVLSKVHHCMADGVSGNELYRIIFDESPTPGRPVEDHWQPQAEPSTLRLTLGAVGELARNPVDQVRLLAQELRTPRLLGARIAETARGLAKLSGALVPASRSSLAGPIGQQRRYAVARAPLLDVIAVAKSFHTTVNDVVLTAISGAFRDLLLSTGQPATHDAIRTLVPVSVRAKGDEGIIDNRVSLLLPFLPVDIADPLQRLREVHQRLAALKASKEAEAGEAMTALAKHEPFTPISLGIRLAAHLPQRNIVTVTTNVPGPRRPLYMLGQRIIEILPYVPIAVRLRTGISVLTYGEQMSFGVTCDYDTGPSAERLARGIADGMAELIAAARAEHEGAAKAEPTASAKALHGGRKAGSTTAAPPKKRATAGRALPPGRPAPAGARRKAPRPSS